ncbi:Tol-Pal system protein TolB [subsurface metagenome]
MKPKYLNNLIEDSYSLFTRIKRGVRTAGLVALVGAIIGVGVYGCKKEEPKKGDTSPTDSVEQKPVTEDSVPKEPVSLEGKLYKQTKIAFVSGRDGSPEIYVMNADGSKHRRLTNNSGDWFPPRDLGPSWSPDGKKIAFHSNRDGNEEIYIVNLFFSLPSAFIT